MLVYLLIKLFKCIQLWFSKNKLKFLKYPFITGFLSSVYDINVKDPNLKKNFMEEVFELGPELWLGYLVHDAPILFILSSVVYPKAFIKYMMFEFWVDLFFAQAYNVAFIFYMFNISLLFPAFGCSISRWIQLTSSLYLIFIIEYFLVIVSELKVINLSSVFCRIFMPLGWFKASL